MPWCGHGEARVPCLQWQLVPAQRYRAWPRLASLLRHCAPFFFPFRPRPDLRARRSPAGLAQPVEQTVNRLAQPLRDKLAHYFNNASTESNPAPFGIGLCRFVVFVVRRHVLGPVSRQGVDEFVLAGEVVAAIMQLHPVAVPRQGDIAGVGVHARRRQHMGAVHRHPLRLVDGRRIAMVDAVVVLEVEGNGSAIVGAHDHALDIDLTDGAERAVLHAEASVVLQEHDAIPAGEAARAALDREVQVIAQIACRPHPLARRLVEGA